MLAKETKKSKRGGDTQKCSRRKDCQSSKKKGGCHMIYIYTLHPPFHPSCTPSGGASQPTAKSPTQQTNPRKTSGAFICIDQSMCKTRSIDDPPSIKQQTATDRQPACHTFTVHSIIMTNNHTVVCRGCTLRRHHKRSPFSLVNEQ